MALLRESDLSSLDPAPRGGRPHDQHDPFNVIA